jgi:hypothetical protein
MGQIRQRKVILAIEKRRPRQWCDCEEHSKHKKSKLNEKQAHF